jgi:drug/metabolite transporter (DMT)-like permease
MSTSQPSYGRAYVALGIAVMSIGFSAIFVSWANAPGAVASFYRMVIPLVLLAWPAYRRARKRGGVSPRGVRLALLAGVFFALDLALWATGVVMSGATNPTLLANTAPVWVGLGAVILFRERLGIKFWVGLFLATAGAMLILGLDTFRAESVGLGTLFGLLAAFFYGGFFLISQRGRQELDSLTYFWISVLGASLTLTVLNLVLRLPVTGYTLPTYLSFLALGLVVQIGGLLAMNYAQGYLPASVVSPTMLGQPVITAILAGPLLGETLSVWQILGGVTVLIGVYVVHRSRLKSREN